MVNTHIIDTLLGTWWQNEFTEVNGTQTGDCPIETACLAKERNMFVYRLCLCVHQMVFTYAHPKVCAEALGRCDTCSKRV